MSSWEVDPLCCWSPPSRSTLLVLVLSRAEKPATGVGGGGGGGIWSYHEIFCLTLRVSFFLYLSEMLATLALGPGNLCPEFLATRAPTYLSFWFCQHSRADIQRSFFRESIWEYFAESRSDLLIWTINHIQIKSQDVFWHNVQILFFHCC
jgi:hypothetical protein